MRASSLFALLALWGCQSDAALTPLGGSDPGSSDLPSDLGSGSSSDGTASTDADDEGFSPEDDEDEEIDGEESDDEDEEDEALEGEVWWGFVQVSGNSLQGEAELIGSTGGQDCVVLFSLRSSTAATGCSACTWAFEVTRSEVETEETAGCAAIGVDPNAMDGTTFKLGYAGDAAIWIDTGAGWAQGGESWNEDGGLSYEALMQGGKPVQETDEGDDDEGDEEDED